MGQKVHALGFRVGNPSKGEARGWEHLWVTKGRDRGSMAQTVSWTERYLREVFQKGGVSLVGCQATAVQHGAHEWSKGRMPRYGWEWTIQVVAQRFLDADSSAFGKEDRKQEELSIGTYGETSYAVQIPNGNQSWWVEGSAVRDLWGAQFGTIAPNTGSDMSEYERWLLSSETKKKENPMTPQRTFPWQQKIRNQSTFLRTKQRPVQTRWAERVEFGWKNFWETMEAQGGCPSLDALSKRLRNVWDAPVRIRVEFVDAFHGAQAYLQYTMDTSFGKKGKKRAWQATFEEPMRNRKGTKPYSYRIWSSGRHNGAEMARLEKVQGGNLSFQRLDDPVQYAMGERLTKYGQISLRFWMLPRKLRPVWSTESMSS